MVRKKVEVNLFTNFKKNIGEVLMRNRFLYGQSLFATQRCTIKFTDRIVKRKSRKSKKSPTKIFS